MLVIISDLHLSDGTSGATIPPGAFHLLAERLEELALRASCRADGGYRPIERIDLLLLGDVLDVIRSVRWLSQPVRPWDDPHSVQFFQAVSSITDEVLRHNETALSVFRRLARDGAISIPPADRVSRPAATEERHAVPVKIHYMVGNHDWFFHLPGENYNRLRQRVVSAMGLCNAPGAPFPHDPREDGLILDMQRRHKVLARHGDLFDPLNYEGVRDASSLGDAIVVELVNRFSVEVEREMGDDLPAELIAGFRELDNVRPTLLAPVWIDGLLERTCPLPSQRQEVKRIWDRMADQFLDLAFVRARDTWSPVDAVDALQSALKFSRRVSLRWASSIVEWLHSLRGADDGSYYRHALAEQDFRNRRAKHIIYGHTHHPEAVALDASYADEHVLNQVYFNSGTWRRVHNPTRLAPDEHEFVACDTMTYLAFYQGDERSGRPYETWTGTLGVERARLRTHRVDAGEPSHATGQSVPASNLFRAGPHFAASPAASPPPAGAQ